MPQDDARATTFGGRGPEDGRMAWRRSARALFDLVRAVTHPYPGAFTTFGGAKLFVWAARPLDEPREAAPGRVAAIGADGIVVGTGGGGLLLQRVQLDGAAEEPAADFARRHGVRAGDVLGGDAAC
jgi:methionyl-tRNA formyltransferase